MHAKNYTEADVGLFHSENEAAKEATVSDREYPWRRWNTTKAKRNAAATVRVGQAASQQ